ncbi:MAG: 16S rRNA (cytosine(1402)-N(4))-methyltransferase RsmH [Actinomycetota bacterium]
MSAAGAGEGERLGHLPVMVERVVDLLAPVAADWVVDATLGLGGHAMALLEAAPEARVLGIDRDPQALEAARVRLARFGERFVAIKASFDAMERVTAQIGIDRLGGALYDLGVSSLQVDSVERGFSYRSAAPLDMRMDPELAVTAADLVNALPRRELTRILREYGEERFASRIASFIEQTRKRHRIETSDELVDLVKAAVPAAARRTGGHPARRTFQALRIAVNGELEQLSDSLPQAIRLLRPGGRLVALSYHSLEDRIVKRALVEAATGCICPPEVPVCRCGHQPSLRLITRRPERPSAGEIEVNPRAESARLRAAEKLEAA